MQSRLAVMLMRAVCCVAVAASVYAQCAVSDINSSPHSRDSQEERDRRHRLEAALALDASEHARTASTHAQKRTDSFTVSDSAGGGGGGASGVSERVDGTSVLFHVPVAW